MTKTTCNTPFSETCRVYLETCCFNTDIIYPPFPEAWHFLLNYVAKKCVMKSAHFLISLMNCSIRMNSKYWFESKECVAVWSFVTNHRMNSGYWFTLLWHFGIKLLESCNEKCKMVFSATCKLGERVHKNCNFSDEMICSKWRMCSV